MTTERIILNEFTRLGDQVRYHRPTDYVRYPELPDGSIGRVVGYHHHISYEPRNSLSFGLRHGQYLRKGAVLVQFDLPDGKTVYLAPSPHDLSMVGQVDKAERRDEAYWDGFRVGRYLGELPEFPVMEGDIIKLSEKMAQEFKMELGMIQRIKYDWAARPHLPPGDQKPRIYDVGPFSGAWSTFMSEDDFTLHERGRYYRYDHHQPVVFTDASDEFRFMQSVGRVQEVRNDKDEVYAWSNRMDIADALERGLADYVGDRRYDPITLEGATNLQAEFHLFKISRPSEAMRNYRETQFEIICESSKRLAEQPLDR